MSTEPSKKLKKSTRIGYAFAATNLEEDILEQLNQPNSSIRARARAELRKRGTKELRKLLDNPGISGNARRQILRIIDGRLEQEITGKDGTVMVLVPAGNFMMGSDQGNEDEGPEHLVYLDSFYMDKYPVTVLKYGEFIEESRPREFPKFWNQIDHYRDARRPVVGVRWYQANEYCESVGKRLPTEAEWEKAARGTDKRVYPWGPTTPTKQKANFSKINWGGYITLSEVDKFKSGQSPYGIYDMAGNVWEWVADWYDQEYYSKSPSRNPLGPETGTKKVLRGGSWNDAAWYLRTSYRDSNFTAGWGNIIGFRCTLDGVTAL